MAAIKLQIPNILGNQDQPQQTPPPPPPPVNFAQFASNPANQAKVAAVVPGLPPPPPPQMAMNTPPPFTPAPAKNPTPPPSPIATMAAQNPKGLVAPGNLPIWNRPVVQNADGSHSTELSFSRGLENGQEVLVPSVVNGKFMTPDGKIPPLGYHDASGQYHPTPQEAAMQDRAWDHYSDTGENLGTFDNPDDADAYAEQLHLRGAAPNYPFSPQASSPQAQIQPRSPAPMVNLPSLQDRLSQAASPSPMQSMPDWQQQNPQLQAEKLSGWQKALRIAAGIAGGGVPGGAQAGIDIHQHDTPAGLQAINQQRYQNAVVEPFKTQQGIADTQAQMQQRQALASKANAQADEYTPQMITPEQAQQMGMPQLAGVTMNGRDISRLSGVHDTNTTKVTTNTADNDTKTATAQQADATRRYVADAANKTRTLLQGMRDSTSTANSQRAHAGGTGVGSGSHKVPADVTKRAALASNVNENADRADEMLQRRPDLVGAAGGRYTNVQDMMGSNDPDIAELGVRMHNIALASNGAHGLRSAEAVQKTEDELFKNFKRGPEGIHSALNATRGSMQTFLDDEKNFATTGQRVPPTTPGGDYAKTATGQSGHKIGLKGGKWYDVQSGRAL